MRSRRTRCWSPRRSEARGARQADRARFLQERLELARAVHLGHDVAAADELALHVELRIGGPARISLERFAQLRLLEDVDVAIVRLERAQGAGRLRREAALREIRRALHEQHDGRGIELRTDLLGHRFIGHRFPRSFSSFTRRASARATVAHWSAALIRVHSAISPRVRKQPRQTPRSSSEQILRHGELGPGSTMAGITVTR